MVRVLRHSSREYGTGQREGRRPHFLYGQQGERGREEKALRGKIIEDIAKKETEFRENLDKVLDAAASQLALYDALANERAAVQEKAIETIANLEKLTSPTTWVSRNGEVPLRHLEVIPETRLPWQGEVVGGHIVYRCSGPIDEEAKSRLEALAKTSGADLQLDDFGGARLIVHTSRAEREMDVFAEDNVIRLTHPEEYAERSTVPPAAAHEE